jgi:hypothetical protein
LSVTARARPRLASGLVRVGLGAFTAVTLAIGLCPAGRLGAQLLRPRLEIAPYAGALLPGELDLQEVDDGVLLGVRTGVRLPGGLAVEGQLGYAPLDSRIDPALGGGEFDLTLLLYEAGLAFALPLPGPLQPFLGLSGGGVRFDPDLEREGHEVEARSSFVLSPGAGVRLTLGNLHLRGDLREHVVFDALEDLNETLSPSSGEGETFQALEASLGLSLLF